jgi:hypothetical protein
VGGEARPEVSLDSMFIRPYIMDIRDTNLFIPLKLTVVPA